MRQAQVSLLSILAGFCFPSSSKALQPHIHFCLFVFFFFFLLGKNSQANTDGRSGILNMTAEKVLYSNDNVCYMFKRFDDFENSSSSITWMWFLRSIVREENAYAPGAHRHVTQALLLAGQITQWFMMFGLWIRWNYSHHSPALNSLINLVLPLPLQFEHQNNLASTACWRRITRASLINWDSAYLETTILKVKQMYIGWDFKNGTQILYCTYYCQPVYVQVSNQRVN